VDAGTGLAGLAVSSFVSATLLPGASEVVLFALLREHPEILWSAVATATIGNTLGGMTSYFLGRLVPDRKVPRGIAWVRRWGVLALLASWLCPVRRGRLAAIEPLAVGSVHRCRKAGALPRGGRARLIRRSATPRARIDARSMEVRRP